MLAEGHTSATPLRFAGENVKVVRERRRHASVVITLETYSHVLPTIREGAAVKMGKILTATA